IGSLPLQNLEEIAVVGFSTVGVALFDRFGNLCSYRTFPGTVRVPPSEAILCARSADDALRVLVHVVTLARLHRIVFLCLHVTVTDLNCVEFIGSDAAI